MKASLNPSRKEQEQKSETLGLSAEDAKQAIHNLLQEREKVATERNSTPQWGETTLTYAALTQSLQNIDDKITEARE